MNLISKLFGCNTEKSNSITPWQHCFHGWDFYSSESQEFLLTFNTKEEFDRYREDLLKNPAYLHLLVNESGAIGEERLLMIMKVCAKENDLDIVSAMFPFEYKRHIAKKEKQELLDLGVSDFVSHIKLLKKKDPELARNKVLKLISEVI